MSSTTLETKIYYSTERQETRQIVLRPFIETKRRYLVYKRCMDVVTAAMVVLFIFPWLFPTIMLLIALDSRGPIFFKQKRVGYLGKTFWCYKFRTMHVNDTADTQQAVTNDPRITRLGKILRTTCLDEMPQFINVLLGDMSIVGPRPHMLSDSLYFSTLVPNYKFRHLLRPGITGMSQVMGYRGPVSSYKSVLQRYNWDTHYVENASFGMDMMIMSRTGWLMLRSLLRRDRAIPEARTGYNAANMPAKKIA